MVVWRPRGNLYLRIFGPSVWMVVLSPGFLHNFLSGLKSDEQAMGIDGQAMEINEKATVMVMMVVVMMVMVMMVMIIMVMMMVVVMVVVKMIR